MSTILITGAAGSLGRELTRTLSKEHTIRAFDSHESGLAALKGDNVRLMLGDINNSERLEFAMQGCDICIHTAAIKNLDLSEYNLESTFETNIFGTINVAKACMSAGVTKAMLVSSDKAVNPVSAYGVSKNAQERIWRWAARVFKDCCFTTCRFGNFIGSSGSCFEVWDRQENDDDCDVITVTDMDATRYFIDIQDASIFIIKIMQQSDTTGYTYIPKMHETRIYDLAAEYTSKEIEITGLREGEKVNEELYSKHEFETVIDVGDYYVL